MTLFSWYSFSQLKINHSTYSVFWSPHPDLNRGPLPYQGSALPLSYVGSKLASLQAQPSNLERVMGIEPTSSAWKAEVLPLNYTRLVTRSTRGTKAVNSARRKFRQSFVENRLNIPNHVVRLPRKETAYAAERYLWSKPDCVARHFFKGQLSANQFSIPICYTCRHHPPNHSILVEGVGFEPT